MWWTAPDPGLGSVDRHVRRGRDGFYEAVD
jgi:hypothetical protein